MANGRAINEPHFLKQRSRAAEDHKCSPISGPSKRQRHTQRSPEAPQIPALGSFRSWFKGADDRIAIAKHKAPFNVEVLISVVTQVWFEGSLFSRFAFDAPNKHAKIAI